MADSSTAVDDNPEKAKENYARLCYLIVTICSKLFRDIASRYIDNSELQGEFDKKKDEVWDFMNADQRKLVYKKKRKKPLTLEDMDISLLAILLRNICSLTTPGQKWMKKKPRRTDKSMAASVQRIKNYRNEIGHLPTGSVPTSSFQRIWDNIKSDVIEINKQLESKVNYETLVNELYEEDLNPSRRKQYIKDFKKVNGRLDLIERKSEKMEERIGTLEENQASVSGDLRKSFEDFKTHMMFIFRETFSALEDKIEERVLSLEKRCLGNRSIQISLTSAELTDVIALPYFSDIRHIVYINTGNLWVSGSGSLKQVDFTGQALETVDDAKCWSGSFDVTEGDYLVYVHKDFQSILKKENGNATAILSLPEESDEIFECIHSSRKNGHLLVVIFSTLKNTCKVSKFDETGEKIRDIEVDDLGMRLYIDSVYITENRNGDIITSDHGKEAVVVVDRSGRHRFDYRGHLHETGAIFCPGGICTDSNGHILVVNIYKTIYIHVLDEVGKLLHLLNERHHNRDWALCLDDKNNIYVGNRKGTIEVYRSLKDS